jgi:hypothetical protein
VANVPIYLSCRVAWWRSVQAARLLTGRLFYSRGVRRNNHACAVFETRVEYSPQNRRHSGMSLSARGGGYANKPRPFASRIIGNGVMLKWNEAATEAKTKRLGLKEIAGRMMISAARCERRSSHERNPAPKG